MPEPELERRIKALEEVTDQLRRGLEQLTRRVDALGGDGSVALRREIEALTAERTTLLKRIDEIAADRPQPTPTQLTQAFRQAIDELRASLEAKPGDRVGYTVGEFDVGLKAHIAVDRDAKTVRFVLPGPGESVAAESLSAVRFVLRAVPQPAVAALLPVPTLIGLPREAGVAALARAGLKLGKTATQELSWPVDTIVGQAPDPGDEIPADIAVDIVVAVKPKVVVPNVVGQERDAAGTILAEARLALGEVTDQPSSVAAGRVIAQNPVAGTRVDPGTAVALVIAIPPATPAPAAIVKVPNLIGSPREGALALIRTAGLTPGIETVQRGTGPRGLVIAQQPAPGADVARGTSVGFTAIDSADPREALERIRVHPQIDRTGVPADQLVERLAALRLPSIDALAAFAEESDAAVRERLALPTLRNVAAVKAIIKAVIDELK